MTTGHLVYHFYPLYFNPTLLTQAEAGRRLGCTSIAEIVESLNLPEALQTQITSKASNTCPTPEAHEPQTDNTPKPVWQIAKFPISDDFHDHIKSLLQGNTHYELTPDAANLFTLAYGRKGKGRLQIKQTSQNGQSEAPITFTIRNVMVQLFPSGIALIVTQLEYMHPNDCDSSCLEKVILQGNYLLSRGGERAVKLFWLDEDGSTTGPITIESILKTLLKGLIACDGCIEIPQWLRVFSYTAVQVTGTPAIHHRELAFRLGRKYNDSYMPSEVWYEQGMFSPFNNIIHSINLEGAAVVIILPDDATKAPPALASFIKDTFKKVYIPIAMLAYSQHLWLLRMLARAGTPIEFENPSKDSIRKLELIKEEFLSFRLNHLFNNLSRLTMHNHVYTLWQEYLLIENMLGEVTTDVETVSSYLSYIVESRRSEQEISHAKKLERLNRNQTTLGIMIGALLFIASIYGMELKEISGLSISSCSFIFPAITIIIFAIYGAYYYYKRSNRKD